MLEGGRGGRQRARECLEGGGWNNSCGSGALSWLAGEWVWDMRPPTIERVALGSPVDDVKGDVPLSVLDRGKLEVLQVDGPCGQTRFDHHGPLGLLPGLPESKRS
jgi:hypothetical protein